MEGIPGRRCPECGGEAKGERVVLRARRRWRWAAFGTLVIVSGVALHATPGVRQHGWIVLLPDRALVAVTFGEDGGSGQELWELERRLRERRLSRSARRALVARTLNDIAAGRAGVTWILELAHEDPALRSAIADAVVQEENRDVRLASIDLFWLFPDQTPSSRWDEIHAMLAATAGDETAPAYARAMAVRGLSLKSGADTIAILRRLSSDASVGREAGSALLRIDPDADAVEALAHD
jgi:hypothetical protein